MVQVVEVLNVLKSLVLFFDHFLAVRFVLKLASNGCGGCGVSQLFKAREHLKICFGELRRRQPEVSLLDYKAATWTYQCLDQSCESWKDHVNI